MIISLSLSLSLSLKCRDSATFKVNAHELVCQHQHHHHHRVVVILVSTLILIQQELVMMLLLLLLLLLQLEAAVVVGGADSNDTGRSAVHILLRRHRQDGKERNLHVPFAMIRNASTTRKSVDLAVCFYYDDYFFPGPGFQEVVN